MEELIEDLTEGLLAVGNQYPELYDADVRVRISELLDEGFVENTEAEPVELPEDFGLDSEVAEAELRSILEAFLDHAAESALIEGYELPEERRALLSDDDLADFVSP